MNERQPMTERDVAAELSLTPSQVRYMAREGLLPGRRRKGSWTFERPAIEEWKRQNREVQGKRAETFRAMQQKWSLEARAPRCEPTSLALDISLLLDLKRPSKPKRRACRS